MNLLFIEQPCFISSVIGPTFQGVGVHEESVEMPNDAVFRLDWLSGG